MSVKFLASLYIAGKGEGPWKSLLVGNYALVLAVLR